MLLCIIYQNLQKENFGRAVLHTLVNAISTTALVDVVTSGIKLLANTSLLGEVGSYVVGFMASHPIIFAVGTTIVAGMAVNELYERNAFKIKEFAESVGDGFNNVMIEITDFIGGMSNSFSANIGSLKAVKRW